MKRFALSLVTLAFAGCVPLVVPSVSAPGPSGGAGAPAAARSAPAGDVRGRDRATVDAVARAILEQVNAARERAGTRALLEDPALRRAAQRYAQELARRGELDHDSPVPGRHTFRDRLAAEGAHPRLAGENLALLTETARGLPRHVVKLWLTSPGHRYNLLDPKFTHTGIGVWLGPESVWYVAEEYATTP